MSVIFRSRLKKHMSDFIRQKRALGYGYIAGEKLLEKFDLFYLEHFPAENTLSKTIALKWSEAHEGESRRSLSDRITVAREFAKYLNGLGISSYVIPTNIVPKKVRYIPHVYTPEELSAIFSAFDRIAYNHLYPVRHLVIPVMFRMIYCCGLRPGEGRTITAGRTGSKNRSRWSI